MTTVQVVMTLPKGVKMVELEKKLADLATEFGLNLQRGAQVNGAATRYYMDPRYVRPSS